MNSQLDELKMVLDQLQRQILVIKGQMDIAILVLERISASTPSLLAENAGVEAKIVFDIVLAQKKMAEEALKQIRGTP